MIDVPATVPEQGRDQAVAVSIVLRGQIEDRPGEVFLVIPLDQRLALRGPELPNHSAARRKLSGPFVAIFLCSQSR